MGSKSKHASFNFVRYQASSSVQGEASCLTRKINTDHKNRCVLFFVRLFAALGRPKHSLSARISHPFRNMTFPQKFSLLLVIFGALAFVFRRWQANYKPRLRHPAPRSKRPDDSYQATNGAAKLLNDVLSLRHRSARWPEVLKTLNPFDEPRIRTILLELRWPNVENPDAVLKVIEDACLSVGSSAQSPTREELLEIARGRISD